MFRITICAIMLGLLLITGCMKDNNNSQPQGDNPNQELTKLSTNNKVDQQIANEAKEIVSQFEEVSGVRAINHDKQLLIAIEVDQFDRFNLKEIEKELKSKMKDVFNTFEVTLSTDKKLFIELKKLEEKMKSNTVTKDNIAKEIESLKSLMKEET